MLNLTFFSDGRKLSRKGIAFPDFMIMSTLILTCLYIEVAAAFQDFICFATETFFIIALPFLVTGNVYSINGNCQTNRYMKIH